MTPIRGRPSSLSNACRSAAMAASDFTLSRNSRAVSVVAGSRSRGATADTSAAVPIQNSWAQMNCRAAEVVAGACRILARRAAVAARWFASFMALMTTQFMASRAFWSWPASYWAISVQAASTCAAVRLPPLPPFPVVAQSSANTGMGTTKRNPHSRHARFMAMNPLTFCF